MHRWEGAVKMHFKEVGYDDVNGIKLAEDKD
jgi:hypothetical protein